MAGTLHHLFTSKFFALKRDLHRSTYHFQRVILLRFISTSFGKEDLLGNSKRKPRTKKEKKRYKIELTSFSILLWCFFILILLSWTFVLGIFVGRGFLPGTVSSISEVKGKINRLQGLVSNKKPDDLIPSEKHDPDPKLAFYEKLSSKKDDVKKSWKPESEKSGGIKTPKEEPRPLFPQIYYTVSHKYSSSSSSL